MAFDDNVFESSLLDYSGDFEKRDKELVKIQIKEWIDEHCSFSANLESENLMKKDDESPDYEITDDLIINVFSNVNVRSDENLPSIIKFGKVQESFFMMGQKLTNTNGFPSDIKESLWLYDNAIEEITDFPDHIGGNCCLRHNKFKNLNGITTNIDGNLDLCDNEDFDYSPRTDGKTINVGISFYGSMDEKNIEKYKNKDAKYIGLAGDKEEANAAFAKYLDEVHCPISVGTKAKKGFIWHSKGDI